MGFINQFPYSDFHELNIDWVIKQIRINEDLIKHLEEEFAKIEVVTEEHINEMISYAIAQNNIQLYEDMNALRTSITTEYQNYVNNKIADIRLTIQQLQSYVDSQDVYYDNLAKTYADNSLTQAKAYTDQKVIDYTYMINPITGNYDDVRDVVNDIVTYFHTDGALTAGEYDALDLTADGYDTYELTAYEYDFNGKNLLV